jgi:hypothetical protein
VVTKASRSSSALTVFTMIPEAIWILRPVLG